MAICQGKERHDANQAGKEDYRGENADERIHKYP
jgi:hypothetical protein